LTGFGWLQAKPSQAIQSQSNNSRRADQIA
jgi:hypothetical protein